MISKIKLIERNWDGENRWRRAELNDMTEKYSLIVNKDFSNKQVFDVILDYVNQEEYFQNILDNDIILQQLYLKFMSQLPSKECMLKNYQGEMCVKKMYPNFVNHNKKCFFKQNKKSYAFLSFVLENKICQTKKDWISLDTKSIFFDGKENYTFMTI